MIATPGVQLHVVETAYGDRHHEVTNDRDLDHLQLRTHSEAWLKESMINLGVKYLLPKNWEYLAFVDCDVHFEDPNWAIETIHQLQHFPVVMPWQTCLDTGHHGQGLQLFKSFGFQHQRRCPKQKWPAQPYEYAHTGFAVACRRDFWENVGGLMDFCILGSADHHGMYACIGEVGDTIHKKMSKGFFRKCYEWQERAMRITKGEVGFTPGHITHRFHGPKKRRYYRERWQILIDHHYDPDTDLMYDKQGLIQLIGKPALEQAIKLYNRSRMEDSIEES